MSAWAERVSRAIEEGTLYVTAEEYADLRELMIRPGPTVYRGPDFALRLDGLAVVVDAEGAARQAEVAPRCLCVKVPSLEDQGVMILGDRLCPIHGPESPSARVAEARRRLAADVKAEVAAQLRGDDGLPPASS